MLFASLAFIAMAPPQEIDLTGRRMIAASAKIRRAVYNLPNSDNSGMTGTLTVRGDNITIDFNGATLRGTPATVEPDQRKGTALIVRGRNIAIKNLKIHGYRNGLIAFDSPGIKIIDCDFSYNYKPHLASTLEREDLSDWMSYHHNEKDEWLTEKAPPIYLRRCNNFEIKNTRIVGGQNGVMLTECNKGLLWNSNVSFLSGVGLAMYKSSENRIMHNNIDWCVRGFSYGVYNRGQDSAGILIYEQSQKNVFAYNSVTHGGDGFFLWAGQTTMDTGKGGCNDNLLYGNDFSHAPTNGIEATFSRNNFVNNLILECWHGIWGGYSYETKIVGNIFGYNAEAIAIEHGQDNEIDRNRFFRDNEGVVLWFNDRPQDPNWGYPKHRNTRSRDYRIQGNEFTEIFTNALRINNTINVEMSSNTFTNNGRLFALSGKNQNLSLIDNVITGSQQATVVPAEVRATNNQVVPIAQQAPLEPVSSLNQGAFRGTGDYLSRFESIKWNPLKEDPRNLSRVARKLTLEELRVHSAAWHYVEPLKGGKDPFLKKGTLRGWRYMLVDEWGPYDFKRPILWPRGVMMASSTALDASGKQTEPHVTTTQVFEVLGPRGSARPVIVEGADITQLSTDGITWTPVQNAKDIPVPSWVQVNLQSGKAANVNLQFEYRGGATTDHRGIVTPAGQAVQFGYQKFFAPIDWNVRWYAWDSASVASPKDKMPRPGEILSRTQLREPLKEQKTDRLDFAWGGSPGAPVPADHFITLADGSFSIPAGAYTLSVTTDDGVRVYVDEKLVIDSWKYQGPTLYTTDLQLGGSHKIRVEHYEIDGYAALKVDLRPKK
jgi:hypothetical protein